MVTEEWQGPWLVTETLGTASETNSDRQAMYRSADRSMWEGLPCKREEDASGEVRELEVHT